MRRWLMVPAGVLLAAAQATGNEPEMDVAAYLADGYEITGKREEERTVPGKPPYEQMKRVLHITTYRLIRGAEQVTCEVTCDSQQDTIATSCR